MAKAIAFILFAALTISGCSQLGNQTKTAQMTTENEPGQDSAGGYALVNGLNMYYEIHGTGTPLVLIHGGGSTIQTSFGRVIYAFAKTHRVIAVELQAHGRTADRNKPTSFEQDADDVAALLKYLNIDKADILGFSNGASTTLELAIRHPLQVNKIIVASTFYKKDGAQPGFWDFIAKASFEGMPQPYKDAFLKENPDTMALHKMYERDVARMQSFQNIPEDLMKKIKAPAFIIIGDADVVTAEHAVEMYRILPQAKLAILPGGHGDYFGEITRPQDSTIIAATVSMINNFLSEPITK
jgi:pimeloyl-ACP methyl ester carboxylesterase